MDINVTKSGEFVLVHPDFAMSNVFKINAEFIQTPWRNDISGLKTKVGQLLIRASYTPIKIANPKSLYIRPAGY